MSIQDELRAYTKEAQNRNNTVDLFPWASWVVQSLIKECKKVASKGESNYAGFMEYYNDGDYDGHRLRMKPYINLAQIKFKSEYEERIMRDMRKDPIVFLRDNGFTDNLDLARGCANKLKTIFESMGFNNIKVECRQCRIIGWRNVDDTPFLKSLFKWNYNTPPEESHVEDYDTDIVLYGIYIEICW